MFSSVTSGAVHGIIPYMMQVEVDTGAGLPGFSMVGYMSGDILISDWCLLSCLFLLLCWFLSPFLFTFIFPC